MVRGAITRGAYKLKSRFNAWRPSHRVCLGTALCVRGQVYQGCCHKHQDVYDPQVAKRLRVTRHHLAQGRRQEVQRKRSIGSRIGDAFDDALDVFDWDD